jgi:diacylglycerol kinase (ATP)
VPRERTTPEPAQVQRRRYDSLRSAVIVNPNRVEGIDDLRREIADQLAEAGWPEPEWLETTAEDPGTGQARQAVENGAEVVFVAGGDGTVRACVEGLAGTDAALAILPGGTGNLLAANLGVPTQSVEGIRLAVERGRRHIDLGESDGQLFAVMAGMGLDAAMMQDAPTALKAKAGWIAYVVAALKHLGDDEMRVEVHVDGDPVRRRRARTVVVGNVGRLQGGTNLLPDADPDDGLLEVAIIAPRNLRHWVELVVGLFRARRRIPSREIVRGSRIAVVSDRPQARQLDGDVIDSARRLDVQVRPQALWVCVEQPDESADLAEGAPARS